jgi:hypothetical protein
MSTRTNVIVSMGDTKTILYRHHDGYPISTGVDLVDKLRSASKRTEEFVIDLLTDKYESGRRIYEITSGIHGDIEWAYFINVGECGETTIGASKIDIGADRERGVLRAKKAAAPISQFVTDFLNPQITKWNTRMAALANDPRHAHKALSMIDLLQIT